MLTACCLCHFDSGKAKGGIVRTHFGRIAIGVLILFATAYSALAQGGRGGGQRGTPSEGTSANTPFDPHDFSGFWARYGQRFGGPQGVACTDCGDAGFGTNVPPFTPEGKRLFDQNKPTYGRKEGQPEASGQPGRNKAVLSALSNDATSQCEPSGLSRIILSTYFSPLEWFSARDRMVQHFEWTNEYREIFTDGRELPKAPDISRWYGYSVGHWEGDTFVVNSYGHDGSTWLDHFGFPHSDELRLEERYRRIAPDKIELIMTAIDPKIYTKPFVGDRKVFRRLLPSEAVVDGWSGLLDDRCVPSEESQFNKTVRDPAAGIIHNDK
jgi:hypothetical protein